MFYRNSMEALVKFARTRPRLAQYVQRLESFHKNVTTKEIAVFVRDENSFVCLNHGDMWVNNLLFGQDNDDKLDVILVGIQIQRRFWFNHLMFNPLVFRLTSKKVTTAHQLSILTSLCTHRAPRTFKITISTNYTLIIIPCSSKPSRNLATNQKYRHLMTSKVKFVRNSIMR